MKNLIIAGFLICLMISCIKRKTTKYEGVVVDSRSAPVSGATITLSYRAEASNFTDGYDAQLQVAVTGADGGFKGQVTLRGKEYTYKFIATTIGPPPRTVDVAIPPPDSTKTMRIVL